MLLGIPVAAIVALAPIFARFDLYGIGHSVNFAGIDYRANPDPVLFFGTIAGDLLTDLFNVLFIALLGLVVRMSMAWSFTEDWGEYYALLLLVDGRDDAPDGVRGAADALPDAGDDDHLPLPDHGVREGPAPVGRGGA